MQIIRIIGVILFVLCMVLLSCQSHGIKTTSYSDQYGSHTETTDGLGIKHGIDCSTVGESTSCRSY